MLFLNTRKEGDHSFLKKPRQNTLLGRAGVNGANFLWELQRVCPLQFLSKLPG